MRERNGESLPPSWERIRVVSGAVATILIPLVIGLTGHWFTSAVKERDTQLRYVELAVGVLREKPDEATTEIRSWAIDVVSRYAPVPLSEAAQSELRRRDMFRRLRAIVEQYDATAKGILESLGR